MSEHMIESLGVSVEDLADALLDTATPFDFADFCAPHSYHHEPSFDLSRSRVADLTAYFNNPEKDVRIAASDAENEAVVVLAFSALRVLEFRASYAPDADGESLPTMAKHACPVKAFVVADDIATANQVVADVYEILDDAVDEAFWILDIQDEEDTSESAAARTGSVLKAFNIHLVPTVSSEHHTIRGNSAFCVIDLSSNPEVRDTAVSALAATRLEADSAHIEAVGIYVTTHVVEGISAT